MMTIESHNNTESLQNVKNHLNAIINTIAGNYWWKNNQGVYLGCNHIVAKLLGFSSATEIIGKTDHELPWKEQAEKLINHDKLVMSTKKVDSYEEVVTDALGNTHVFLVTKSPLIDEKNEVIGTIGTSVEITEKKQVEIFKQEKLEADKKSHYMQIAAGSIAHDLRTPLSSIKFAMNAIESVLPRLLETYHLACKQGLKTQSIRKNKLDSLETVITRCKAEIDFSNHYIDLILGNLKHESIDTDNYEHHDIIKIIDYSLDTYPYKSDEKNLIHWQPNIDFNFFGNDFYLKNVINNLLKNSLFYIKKCERGEIYITTEQTAENYLLKVKDTAQGASPEVLQHMFDGYYSKREGGTGLGLAFCKTIMKSFGGDIQAESVEGEYMLFILSFPKKI